MNQLYITWLAWATTIAALIWGILGWRRLRNLREAVRASGKPAGAGGCIYQWMDGCRFGGPDPAHRLEDLISGAVSSFGRVPLGGINDPTITVECNISDECFSIRQKDGEKDELIHFCDWKAMKATIDAFQTARSTGHEPSM